MDCKRFLCSLLELLSWITLLSLSIGLFFFVKEVWNSFISKDTNDRVYSIQQRYFQHPTITICFEPQLNETALKKYNIEIEEILNHYPNENLNMSVPLKDFVDDVGYKVGRDFKLDFTLTTKDGRYDKISIDHESYGKDFNKVQTEELIGLFYGTCTILKINEELKSPAQTYSGLTFNFNGTDEDDLPIIKIIFTSKNNSYGSFYQQWMEGEKYEIVINPLDRSRHIVNLRQENRLQFNGKSNCSNQVSFYECVSKR